jgi:uncharacterized membrane protein YkoI
MDKQERRWSVERLVAVVAIAVGLGAGTYGIASAASGGDSSQASAAASGGWPVVSTPAASAPNGQRPWGRQRSDERLLTGKAETRVRQAALAKVSGATIVRVETDADGNAAYEAHMVKADGTPATVYVDKRFGVVSVESRMPAPPGRAPAASSGASA